MTDPRSSLTHRIMTANPHAYEALVVHGPTPALAMKLLDGVTSSQLFDAPTSTAHADGALAGLWLWHDGLAESHAISQAMHDATGSFWHAIMHRREGDFSNSKYWYAKAGRHAAIDVLAAQAGAIVGDMPADKSILRIVVRGFDPNALVDLVEQVHDEPTDPRYTAAVRLQQLEWRVLFDFCMRG